MTGTPPLNFEQIKMSQGAVERARMIPMPETLGAYVAAVAILVVDSGRAGTRANGRR